MEGYFESVREDTDVVEGFLEFRHPKLSLETRSLTIYTLGGSLRSPGAKILRLILRDFRRYLTLASIRVSNLPQNSY